MRLRTETTSYKVVWVQALIVWLTYCESLINFVKAEQAKVADRLEPKGVQLATLLH